MEAHGLIPEILDEVPPNKIQIIYENNVMVNDGDELKPAEVIDQPLKMSWPTEPNSFYTLSMIDPDGPTRSNPTSRQVNHWLVINIPGTDVQSGDLLVFYNGSKPPANSGIHRYTFTVFKQPSGGMKPDFTPVTPTSPREARRHFDVRKFAEKNNLGKPIAGNFFTAQADEYSINFWANMPK